MLRARKKRIILQNVFLALDTIKRFARCEREFRKAEDLKLEQTFCYNLFCRLHISAKSKHTFIKI